MCVRVFTCHLPIPMKCMRVFLLNCLASFGTTNILKCCQCLPKWHRFVKCRWRMFHTFLEWCNCHFKNSQVDYMIISMSKWLRIGQNVWKLCVLQYAKPRILHMIAKISFMVPQNPKSRLDWPEKSAWHASKETKRKMNITISLTICSESQVDKKSVKLHRLNISSTISNGVHLSFLIPLLYSIQPSKLVSTRQ